MEWFEHEDCGAVLERFIIIISKVKKIWFLFFSIFVCMYIFYFVISESWRFWWPIKQIEMCQYTIRLDFLSKDIWIYVNSSITLFTFEQSEVKSHLKHNPKLKLEIKIRTVQSHN